MQVAITPAQNASWYLCSSQYGLWTGARKDHPFDISNLPIYLVAKEPPPRVGFVASVLKGLVPDGQGLFFVNFSFSETPSPIPKEFIEALKTIRFSPPRPIPPSSPIFVGFGPKLQEVFVEYVPDGTYGEFYRSLHIDPNLVPPFVMDILQLPLQNWTFLQTEQALPYDLALSLIPDTVHLIFSYFSLFPHPPSFHEYEAFLNERLPKDVAWQFLRLTTAIAFVLAPVVERDEEGRRLYDLGYGVVHLGCGKKVGIPVAGSGRVYHEDLHELLTRRKETVQSHSLPFVDVMKVVELRVCVLHHVQDVASGYIYAVGAYATAEGDYEFAVFKFPPCLILEVIESQKRGAWLYIRFLGLRGRDATTKKGWEIKVLEELPPVAPLFSEDEMNAIALTYMKANASYYSAVQVFRNAGKTASKRR